MTIQQDCGGVHLTMSTREFLELAAIVGEINCLPASLETIWAFATEEFPEHREYLLRGCLVPRYTEAPPE